MTDDKITYVMNDRIAGYYLFYILVYALVIPVFLETLPIFLYKDFNLAYPFLGVHLGIGVIAIAAAARHSKFKLKLQRQYSMTLLVAGICIEISFISSLIRPAIQSVGVALSLIIVVIMSAGWILFYFVDSSKINGHKNKLLFRKLIKYLLFCFFSLHITQALMSKYYTEQISAGPLYVKDGLGNVELIEQKNMAGTNCDHFATELFSNVIFLFL